MFVTALGAFIGALLTLVISIYIEYQRKPKLYFEIEDPPSDNTYTSGPAREARSVRVHLCNRAMPSWLRWLGRNAAMQCGGHVQFYHLDNGSPVFSMPMLIRWASSDEPLSFQMLPNGQLVQLFDSAKYNAAFLRNCFPGGKETVDIATRFDNDEECYGWCNESYLPSKGWRNPDWKLPKGRYLVRVVILSAGEKVSDIFQLENSVARQHFRLMMATKHDISKIRVDQGTS
jgi:hypothetical protein